MSDLEDLARERGGCGEVINVDAWCDADAVPSTAGLCDSPDDHHGHTAADIIHDWDMVDPPEGWPTLTERFATALAEAEARGHARGVAEAAALRERVAVVDALVRDAERFPTGHPLNRVDAENLRRALDGDR